MTRTRILLVALVAGATLLGVGIVVALNRGPIVLRPADKELEIRSNLLRQGLHEVSVDCPDTGLRNGETAQCTLTYTAGYPRTESLIIKAQEDRVSPPKYNWTAGAKFPLRASPEKNYGVALIVPGALIVLFALLALLPMRIWRDLGETTGIIATALKPLGRVLIFLGKAVAVVGAILFAIFGATASAGSQPPGGQRQGGRRLGTFGNTTIYQRPDGSRYGLDRSGRLAEVPRNQQYHP